MLLKNASISDFNGPSGNPPDDDKDPPCELLNEDQITATICAKCNLTCEHRVEMDCLTCKHHEINCELLEPIRFGNCWESK